MCEPANDVTSVPLGTVSLTGELTGPIVGIENKSTKKSSRSSRILASARAPESPVRVSGGVSPPPSFRVSLVCGLGSIGDAKLLVHDVDELANVIRTEAIDVIVLAVPAKAAQRVLNQVMSAGIKAVLNFAP